MRSCRLLGKVEHANNLVVLPSRELLGCNFLHTHDHQYMRQRITPHPTTYLGIDVSFRQVTKHFVGVELALMLPILSYLKYANLAALSRGKLDLLVFGELLA